MSHILKILCDKFVINLGTSDENIIINRPMNCERAFFYRCGRLIGTFVVYISKNRLFS